MPEKYIRTKDDLFVFYKNMEIGFLLKRADYYRSVSKKTLHRIGVCKLKDEEIVKKSDNLIDVIDSIVAVLSDENIANSPYVVFKKSVISDYSCKLFKSALDKNLYEGFYGAINFKHPNGLPAMVPVARLNTDTWKFEEL